MHVIIIGNGIAGVTAARTIRELNDHRVTVISDEAPFHFSRPAMMYVSTGQLSVEHIKPYDHAQWDALGITMLHDAVMSIDPDTMSCKLASGHKLSADVLILATGSEPVVPALNLASQRTVVTYSRLEDIARLDRELEKQGIAAVVGGGLIGTEVAEILHVRRKPFTWFVREQGIYGSHLPREESELLTAHIRSFGVHVQTDVDAVSDGNLSSYDLVVMCTGVRPRIDLALSSNIACEVGICVNDRFETNARGIYAIGDCAQTPWGVDQRWYAGKEQGKHLAHLICAETEPYQPSIYRNSAKFFELEWQVYGNVPADGKNSVFQHDAGGERCARFAHDGHGVITGLQTLGMRLRQDVCERWIHAGAHIDDVMRDFANANFDPEFTSRFAV